VPLPGCSRRASLTDSLSALDVKLSNAEVARLSDALPAGALDGTRYPEQQMSRLGI
jgi:aryl-alcohol dehydrogenase-like predicted oxidoreductase